MVYYGDEVGLEGEEDPDCRRCLPWDAAQHNRELFNLYRRLINLRHRHAALRRGTFEVILLNAPRRLYGYRRRWQGQSLLVVLNAGPEEQVLGLAVDGPAPYYDLLRERPVPVVDGRLSLRLEPFSGSILGPARRAPAGGFSPPA